MIDTANPYRPGEPVAAPTMLFGRQEALDWLEQQLHNNARTMLISGSPLIGKTSLIKQAGSHQNFEAFNLFVTLDTPRDDRRSTGGDAISQVLQNVVDQLLTQLQLFSLLTATSVDQAGPPSLVIRELFAQAQQQIGPARLVVYIDDLHLLITDDMSLVASFLTTLTPLLDDCPQLHLAFTINHDQLRRVRHPLLDRAPTFHLGPLAPDASISMVTLPVKNILRFDYGVSRRIAEINSHHPYYLTLFCYNLLNRQMYDGWVNQRDFDQILTETLDSPIEPFHQIWEFSGWTERAVLAGMAHIQGTHGPLTRQEVIRFLQKLHSPVTENGVIDALKLLADRGVLIPMGHISYRFHVELFRFWLRKHTNPAEIVAQVNWPRYIPTKQPPSPTSRTWVDRRQESTAPQRQFSRLLILIIVIMGCLLTGSSLLAAQYLGVGLTSFLASTPTATTTLDIAPLKDGSPAITTTTETESLPPTTTTTPQPTAPPTPSPVPVQVRTLPALTYMAREVNEGWRIYTMNADGSDVLALSPEGADDRGPVWAPGGSRVAYISQQDGNREIYVMDADGQNRLNLTRNPADDWTPAWSPDGQLLAFSSIRSGQWEIYLMDMTCLENPATCPERVTQITTNGQNSLSPAWSPDGNRLAFNSRAAGDWDIYTMTSSGSDVRQITTSEANELAPSWSPDGSRIAFESDQEGNVEIFTINANGGVLQNITNYPLANDHGPTWSPDGQQIVFYSNREGNWDLFKLNLDDQEVINLTQTPTRDEQTPAWRP